MRPSLSTSRPDASVVLCTWNRASALRVALDELFRQDLPSDRYEIIVVDNGSTDDTPSLLRSLSGRVRVVNEARLGVAFAREAGWRSALSDTIVFIDDDCLAPPHWLRVLTGALASRGPEVGCVGGRVIPAWPAPRPAWLSEPLLGYLGLQDLGPDVRPIASHEWLCSNNLALRRVALEQANGFRTDLGRRGRRLTDGAETDLEQRLMKSGFTCWYDPAPTVTHCVQPERLAPGWFLRRAFWSGASARWTSEGSLDAGVCRGGIAAGRSALRRIDAAAIACTAARAAGYAYATVRPNPDGCGAA